MEWILVKRELKINKIDILQTNQTSTSRIKKPRKMKEIEKILTSKVEKFITENPYNGNGTVNGMLKRTEHVRNNIENVRVSLNNISNKYVEDNPDTDIIKLTEIAQGLLNKYLTSFTKC